MPRPLSLALHWLLIAALLVSAALVPAQIARAAMHGDSHPPVATEGMPCHEQAPPAQPDPCDGCSPATCDLAACLGTACLPAMARVMPLHTAVASAIPWHSSDVAIDLRERPLRPPIA